MSCDNQAGVSAGCPVGFVSLNISANLATSDPSVAVRALKSAAPYIRMYKNKVFVIKAGGAVFSDDASTRGWIEQVAILHQVGIKTVLVHGGTGGVGTAARPPRGAAQS